MGGTTVNYGNDESHLATEDSQFAHQRIKPFNGLIASQRRSAQKQSQIRDCPIFWLLCCMSASVCGFSAFKSEYGICSKLQIIRLSFATFHRFIKAGVGGERFGLPTKGLQV